MNERIKTIRKRINLTQDEFAEKLGLARNSIASYESGRRTPNDAIIKLICKEFNVDYFWLTEGTGEMFTKVPETLIDKLASQYNLSDKGKIILKTYLNLSEEQQDALENFLLTLAENIKKESD